MSNSHDYHLLAPLADDEEMQAEETALLPVNYVYQPRHQGTIILKRNFQNLKFMINVSQIFWKFFCSISISILLSVFFLPKREHESDTNLRAGFTLGWIMSAAIAALFSFKLEPYLEELAETKYQNLPAAEIEEINLTIGEIGEKLERERIIFHFQIPLSPFDTAEDLAQAQNLITKKKRNDILFAKNSVFQIKNMGIFSHPPNQTPDPILVTIEQYLGSHK